MLFWLAAAVLPCSFFQDAGENRILLVYEERENAAWTTLLERTEELLSGDGAVQRAPRQILEAASTDAGHLPPLELYAVVRRQECHTGWLVQFEEVTGVTTFEAVDVVHGLRVIWGTKVRAAGGNELSAEQEEMLLGALQHARDELRALHVRLQEGSPYDEAPRWFGLEDPPHLGFRWRYDERPVATFVFPTSLAADAGLRAGDEIIGVNGVPIGGAAEFGRAVGPMKAGDPLALEVQRGEERKTVESRVESSRDLVPRFEATAVGRSLAELLGEDLPEAWKDPRGKVLCIPVFAPRFPASFENFVELRWLLDTVPHGELVIHGLARETEPAALKQFLEETKPGWAALADPSGRLADALRVADVPAILWVDGEGVVRFRWARGADLQRAFQAVRGPR